MPNVRILKQSHTINEPLVSALRSRSAEGELSSARPMATNVLVDHILIDNDHLEVLVRLAKGRAKCFYDPAKGVVGRYKYRNEGR